MLSGGESHKSMMSRLSCIWANRREEPRLGKSKRSQPSSLARPVYYSNASDTTTRIVLYDPAISSGQLIQAYLTTSSRICGLLRLGWSAVMERSCALLRLY